MHPTRDHLDWFNNKRLHTTRNHEPPRTFEANHDEAVRSVNGGRKLTP